MIECKKIALENITMEKCRNFKKCGGCQLPNLEYGEQLAYKQRQAEFLLGTFCRVNEIIGMENPLHYRNKATAVFFRDRRTGKTGSGIYQGNSGKIMPIDYCLLENEKSNEIVQTVCKLANSFKLKPFDIETGSGFLRHILIRRGFKTNRFMVVIVTAAPDLRSKRSFINALEKSHPEITTIVQNINPDGEVLTLGEKSEVLFGNGYIEDELCGCRFRISPESFYQINPIQTETLYGNAMEFAELTGEEKIFDAYCGTGTIGIIAAENAKEAIGVEINQSAVNDANYNAKLNGKDNIKFECADAGDYLTAAAKNGEHFDVLFMDPPRAGATVKFLKSAVKAQPQKIVYISCNPKTLARDLKYLTKNGYEVKKIQPVDMFPMTKHIETVCLLS